MDNVANTEFVVEKPQGHRHVFRVVSVRNGKISDPSQSAQYIYFDAPTISVSRLTEIGVWLEWTAVQGATVYRATLMPINIANVGEDSAMFPMVEETSKLTIPFSDLNTGVSFQVSVIAGSSHGFASNASNVVLTPLQSVRDLSAQFAEDPTVALLQWSKCFGATEYVVQKQQVDAKVKQEIFIEATIVRTPEATIEGLDGKFDYRFRVFAAANGRCETVGALVDLFQPIDMENDKVEETIDKMVLRQLREAEDFFPGITALVYKLKSNTYLIGSSKILNLEIQGQLLMIRVGGGGYQEFSSWIRKHQSEIRRIMAAPSSSSSNSGSNRVVNLRLQTALPITAFDNDDDSDTARSSRSARVYVHGARFGSKIGLGK
jgi:hypothetical protein